MYFGLRGRDCIYESCLMNWLGVSFDGALYPCGRSYPDDYMLGNLSDYQKLTDIFESDSYTSLLIQSIIRRDTCQNECKYYGLCHGGCNNNCIIENVHKSSETFMCKVFCTVYTYIEEWLDSQLDNGTYRHIKNPILHNLLSKKACDPGDF